MKKCQDCQTPIYRGVRCVNCSKKHYKETRRVIKMHNCIYTGKNGCDNKQGKGFNNPQALKIHIQNKHNPSIVEKLQTGGISSEQADQRSSMKKESNTKQKPILAKKPVSQKQEKEQPQEKESWWGWDAEDDEEEED